MGNIIQFKPKTDLPPAPRNAPETTNSDGEGAIRWLLTDILLAVAYYAYQGDTKTAMRLNNYLVGLGMPAGATLPAELERDLLAANLDEAMAGPGEGSY